MLADDLELAEIEVDVVAISMGGLIARYAAMPLPDDSRQLRIRRLFTISTPHRGAKLAALPTFDQRQIDMRPGSAFLASLDDALADADYDLLPYVRGEADGVPHDTLFWTQDHYRVVRHQGWKLQRNGPNDEFVWLFDLANDPTEQRNLATEHPDKVAELDAILAAHLAEQAPPRWPSGTSMPVTIDRHLNQPEAPDDEFVYYLDGRPERAEKDRRVLVGPLVEREGRHESDRQVIGPLEIVQNDEHRPRNRKLPQGV